MKLELRFNRVAPEIKNDVHTIIIEHAGKRYEIRECGVGLTLAVCEPIAEQLIMIGSGSNTVHVYAGSERDIANGALSVKEKK